jgi:hypothetical protein
MVLDQRALDSSAVGGKSAYNANDLVYDSAVSTYDGTFTHLASSTANLNGLSASIASTPNVVVSAESALGELTSSSSSSVSHFASSAASLGSINSTATTIPQILPTFDASLGDLANVVQATVTHVATAEAVLGELLATANTTPTIKPVFIGSLGTIDASATATVIRPTPPEPEPQGNGSNRTYPTPPIIKRKPVFIPQPEPVIITKTLPARPIRMPETITAATDSVQSSFTIDVVSQVEWSILNDEAELLLML